MTLKKSFRSEVISRAGGRTMRYMFRSCGVGLGWKALKRPQAGVDESSSTW